MKSVMKQIFNLYKVKQGHIMLNQKSRFSLFLVSISLFMAFTSIASAETGAALERSSRAALNSLISQNESAKELSSKAIAVLVFPDITKAGLLIGGQYGEGVLWRGDKATAFYNTAGASLGLQAGAQEFGYALFFMTEKAVSALNQAQGFEVGVGPSIVVIDQGVAKANTTLTMQDDIYAFIFGQKGLMAGIGIQGNKISKINK
jgi:lipid-binding SYLF domain-containing protein